MLTIARNVSINMLPSRRVDPVDPALLAEVTNRPHADGPEERVTNSEYLRRALARVPEDQRRPLVLAAFYGFTAKG